MQIARAPKRGWQRRLSVAGTFKQFVIELKNEIK